MKMQFNAVASPPPLAIGPGRLGRGRGQEVDRQRISSHPR